MKKNKSILLTIGIAIVALIALLGLPYNGLVKSEQNVESKWSQVEVVTQRRADLIPNLVQTVKGYAEHEQETFQAITEARSQVKNSSNPGELAEAEGQLNSAMDRLMVVVENYPELKADQQYIQLQDELAGTENRISTERKNYNESVEQYNVKTKTFPTVITANLFGFDEKEFFEADEGSENAPEVNFD